jgi:hypothetical protein
VTIGGALYAKWSITRHEDDCFVKVTRYFVNEKTGRTYSQWAIEQQNLIDDEKISERIYPLPFDMTEPGYYEYRLNPNYYCNPAAYIFGPASVHLTPIRFKLIK